MHKLNTDRCGEAELYWSPHLWKTVIVMDFNHDVPIWIEIHLFDIPKYGSREKYFDLKDLIRQCFISFLLDKHLALFCCSSSVNLCSKSNDNAPAL